MPTLSFSQYATNKDIKQSLPFMNGHYAYKGNLYTPKEIDELLPTSGRLMNANDIKRLEKGENKNKSINFLKDQQSY